MLHLLFRLGPAAFAVAAGEIAAVLPLPELSPVTRAPPYMAGLLRYQGQFIPVIDLKVLQSDEACRRMISTRILLVSMGAGDRLGLLVEEALEMLELAEPQTLPSGLFGPGRDWLGTAVFDTPLGLVQRVDWQALLTPELRALMAADRHERQD